MCAERPTRAQARSPPPLSNFLNATLTLLQRGAVTANGVFNMICNGFLDGTAPSICSACQFSNDLDECVTSGGTSGGNEDDTTGGGDTGDTPFDDCDCPDGWSCDESQMRRLEKKHLRKAGRKLFGVEVPHYCVVTAN